MRRGQDRLLGRVIKNNVSGCETPVPEIHVVINDRMPGADIRTVVGRLIKRRRRSSGGGKIYGFVRGEKCAVGVFRRGVTKDVFRRDKPAKTRSRGLCRNILPNEMIEIGGD